MIRSFGYNGQEIKFEITNPDDHLQKYWLKGHFYEERMLKFIENRWKNKAYPYGLKFIDVGACIGNHTIFFAKIIGAQVLAIEPGRDNSHLMWKNILLNSVEPQVEPWFEFAAGNKIGLSRLKLDHSGNSGMHKISEDGDEVIKIITIDHVVSHPFRIHLIKIDVEGYNIPVLSGGRRMIEKNHPEIYIEAGTDQELQEVESFLLPLGYKRWPTHFNATPTYFFYWES